MTRPSTSTADAIDLPAVVRELVERAQLGDAALVTLAHGLHGLNDVAADPLDADQAQALRRLIALDAGWVLAASEPDVAVATRTRARLLSAAGDDDAAANAWVDAAEVALAQARHDDVAADVTAAVQALGERSDASSTLLERLATLAAAIGHPSAAALWVRAADVCERGGDAGSAARALHQAWWASEDADSAALLTRAAAIDEAGGWGDRARFLLAYLDERLVDAQAHAVSALQHARREQDRPLEALALHSIACVRSMHGDLADAIVVQRQALAVAQVIGDERTLDSGGVNLVMMLHDDLRDDEALHELDRVRGARELSGEPGPIVEAAMLRVLILHARGRIQEATNVLDEHADAGCAGEPIARAYGTFIRLLLGIDAGIDDASFAVGVAELRHAALVTGMGSLATRAVVLEALRLLDGGDAAAACRLLCDVDVDDAGLFGIEIALPLLRAGVAARDARAVARAAELLDGLGCTTGRVRVARREAAAARSLLEDGDARPLQVVIDEWRRRSRPIEAGRVLLAAAAATTRSSSAEQLAEQARGALAATGAAALLARAAAMIDDGDDALAPVVGAAIFDGVDAAVRDELLTHAIDVRRSAGSVLHEAMDCVDRLWVVRAGTVRLCRATDDDRRLTIELLDAGAVLGEHGLLGLPTAGTLAECETSVVLASLPIEHVRAAMARCPRLAANLLAVAGNRLERSRQLAERVAFWTVDRRIARCLLDLDAQYGRPTLDGHRIIDRPFTHFQLAELVNARRETVGDFLKRMRAGGAIELRRRCIVLLDPAALQRIVEAAS